MMSFESTFLRGVGAKAWVLGAFLTVSAVVVAGAHFGVSTGAGAVLSGLNLRFVRWIMNRLAASATAGEVKAWKGTLVLVVKMVAIFGAVWILIARMGLDAVGFAIGFSSFLPAIGWQVWESRGGLVGPSDPADEA